MHYSQLNPFDTVNGEGARVSLFVSGCSLNCPGCHNKEVWNYKFGEEFTSDTSLKILYMVGHSDISGLSILGGEPLAIQNRSTVLQLCRTTKLIFPKKTIWLWSGYTLEEIKDSFPDILKWIDVLVDGSFKQELADPNLEWRGSSNQRIIRITDGIPME